ncbi:MAG: hypothetical protein KC478_00685 [Bacteriovoracaceae bacterium]|nr:hypothetical protein [Bacteriovoracaceae bacterium]
MKIIVLFSLFIILPFQSCSTHKDMGQNQIIEGHFRLYTYPEKPNEYLVKSDGERYQDIVFAAINDLEGKIHPNSYSVIDPAQNYKYDIKIGGLSAYKAYTNILKQKFGSALQLVSSGSLFSEKANMNETIFYLNYLGLDASGLSKSDFTLPFRKNYMQELDKRLKSAKFPVLSSNVFNLSIANKFQFENIKESVIVSAGKVKVGYISLIAPALAQTFDSRKLNKTYFESMAPKIITLSNELRKKGADVVALMASHGLDCTSQQAETEHIDSYKVNFMPNDEKVCDLFKNELALTLKKLPPSMVDIVFTNGMNSKVSNVIAGHPVLQSYEGAEHLSWAKLVYDTKLKRVVKTKTQLMQPIQMCHSFFRETQDCYVKEVLRNIEITPAKFLGEEVKVQPLPTRI